MAQSRGHRGPLNGLTKGCCNCSGHWPTLAPALMSEGRTRGVKLPDQDPGGSDPGQDALAKAGERDIEGRDRDLAADVRDRVAEQRDREAAARDDAAGDLDRTAGDRAASDSQQADGESTRPPSGRAEA